VQRWFGLLLCCFLGYTASSQTVQEIDSVKKEIDGRGFTDTVLVNDTIYDLSLNRVGIGREREITGYLRNDTLLKAIVKFRNSSRIRVVYYAAKEYAAIDGDVIYLKDYDSITGESLTEIYAYHHPDSVWNKILQTNIISPHNEDERDAPLLITERGSYRTYIRFKQIDNKAKKYDFIVELIEDPTTVPPACGDQAYTTPLKFYVHSSSDSFYFHKRIYITKNCFSVKDLKIYRKARLFKVHAATNDGTTFGFSVFWQKNDWEKPEKIPLLFGRAFTQL